MNKWEVQSRETRDSAAELEIVLCWFPPVAGLKGIQLRPPVSDLVAGFSVTPSWYERRCPPRRALPGLPPPALRRGGLGPGQSELRFPRLVLEGTMPCPGSPHVPRLRFH